MENRPETVLRRREFLKTTGLGLASLAVGQSLLAPSARAAEPRKPNIIFVLADDLGIGDVGCYGQKLIQTPCLDRMAVEGTRFTQAYTGCPVCAPARCSLMTGLHMGHSYIRDNREVQPEGQLPIPAETVTVAKVLKSAGYATGLIGKWGLGAPGSESEPTAMGFDYFFGYNCQRKAHEYYPEYLWRNREKVVLEKNQNGQQGQYSHDLMAAEALEFVKKHKDHPFFLYLAFTIPHGKYQVPDLKPYEDKDWKPQEKAYAAMITRLDRDVGRLLERLKELNLDSETLVLFASDNGPAFQGGIFNSAMGLRGFKRFLHEGGIREPMLARWPGKVPAGKVSDFQWAFWDFLPTAAELAGAKTPEGLDGISIVPTLLGQEQKPHEYLYWEFYSPFQQAVRLGDWKGYRTGLKEPLELYDLSKDVAEKENVAAANPEVVRKLEQIMATAHTDSAHWKTRDRAAAPEKGAAKKKAAKAE